MRPVITTPLADAKIYKAMHGVMSDLKVIAKSEKNTHFKYMFRSVDAAMTTLQPLLVKHGVVLETFVKDIKCEPCFKKSKYDKVDPTIPLQNRATLHYGIRWIAVEDGSSMVSEGVGEGIGDDDKATYKALSGALKYIVFHTFMVPTDDRSDAEYDEGAEDPGDSNAVKKAMEDIDKLKTKAKVKAYMNALELGKAEYQTVREYVNPLYAKLK